MPTYKGPCARCGEPVRRYIKPNRGLHCVSCAIDVAQEHNRSMSKGTNPHLKRVRASGARQGQEIAMKNGEAYERWLDGMKRFIEADGRPAPKK